MLSVVGILLMITTMMLESEPGALPLIVTLTGLVWYLYARFSK